MNENDFQQNFTMLIVILRCLYVIYVKYSCHYRNHQMSQSFQNYFFSFSQTGMKGELSTPLISVKYVKGLVLPVCVPNADYTTIQAKLGFSVLMPLCAIMILAQISPQSAVIAVVLLYILRSPYFVGILQGIL